MPTRASIFFLLPVTATLAMKVVEHPDPALSVRCPETIVNKESSTYNDFYVDSYVLRNLTRKELMKYPRAAMREGFYMLVVQCVSKTGFDFEGTRLEDANAWTPRTRLVQMDQSPPEELVGKRFINRGVGGCLKEVLTERELLESDVFAEDEDNNNNTQCPHFDKLGIFTTAQLEEEEAADVEEEEEYEDEDEPQVPTTLRSTTTTPKGKRIPAEAECKCKPEDGGGLAFLLINVVIMIVNLLIVTFLILLARKVSRNVGGEQIRMQDLIH